MSLTTLPQEIIIIIIKQLNLKSVINLYNTCSYIRNIVCMYGVIRECNMSLNTLATAQSLHLQFFKDISGHLKVLNMCGVHDLYKSSLLPAMKNLKCLQTLNIAFTNITILDLLEIYHICPTLKDIAINFHFYKDGVVKIPPQEVLVKCQNLFQHFENVHFVGSSLNLFSGLASYILKEAKLNMLTYTISERQITTFNTSKIEEQHSKSQCVQFNIFSIYILNWRVKDVVYVNIFSWLDLKCYEFIVIMVLNINTYKVCLSPLLKKFFEDRFGIYTECIIDSIESHTENMLLMVWNKETTKFDDTFYSYLFKHLQQFFPCNLNSPSSLTNRHEHSWYFIVPHFEDVDIKRNKNFESEFKRKRLVPQNLTLDFDDMFRENQNVQLSIYFNEPCRNPVSLSASTMYLKKLTFLSLIGSVKYSGEFFNLLFRCCDKLITLNVEAPPLSPCAAPISRSIPLSCSMKNLRIIDKKIDFKSLFSSLSQCKTLENIQIHDISQVYNDVADPCLLFEKCDDLYYFSIQASMTDTAKTKKSQMLNKARTRCGKHHLHIKLTVSPGDHRYSYDPFISVFKLNPINQPLMSV